MKNVQKTLGQRVDENKEAINEWPKWMQDTARFEGSRSEYWNRHRIPDDGEIVGAEPKKDGR